MIITVIFKNEFGEEFDLDFNLYETHVAKKWSKWLMAQLMVTNDVYEKDRMYGFKNGQWTEELIVDELNKCIQTINKYEEIIDIKAFMSMSQEHLNHLHLFFENLRGGILSESDFWKTADEDQRISIERFNLLIHRMENLYSSIKKNYFGPRIVCRFKNRSRCELKDSDYDHFTLVRKFGEVYINYCEIGKPLFDVFKDGDEIVGEDNIRPLRYLSPDFTVCFHKRSRENVEKSLSEMDEWWDVKEENLSALGFTKGDPKNSIGNIPVAMIDTELSEEEVVLKLEEYPIIDRVEAFP